MLKVTQEQLTVMSRSLDADALSAKVYRVVEVLQGVSVIRPRLENLPVAQIVEEVILAAERFGVVDFDDLCKWSYIRILTGVAFYEMSEFRYFLDDPLIHPQSKGRNIVTAFHLAAERRI